MKTKPTVVIDTNIVVSALRSRNGASHKLMQLVGTDKFIMNISVGLVLEYEEMLTRQFHNLGKGKIKDFLDFICAASKHIKIHFLWRPVLKDPDDDMLLELAVASNANYIITYNTADFKKIDKFNIDVITPKKFLELIGELA